MCLLNLCCRGTTEEARVREGHYHSVCGGKKVHLERCLAALFGLVVYRYESQIRFAVW